jgi:hypothetical protein
MSGEISRPGFPTLRQAVKAYQASLQAVPPAREEAK